MDNKQIASAREKLLKNPAYIKLMAGQTSPRKDIDLSKLSSEAISELINHNMLKPDASFHDELEYYMEGDDKIHIVTDKMSWKRMSGRHWVFDLNTNKIRLIMMN